MIVKHIRIQQEAGLSGLVTIWVRFVPNEARFVPFRANLTQFASDLDTPDKKRRNMTSRQWRHANVSTSVPFMSSLSFD